MIAESAMIGKVNICLSSYKLSQKGRSCQAHKDIYDLCKIRDNIAILQRQGAIHIGVFFELMMKKCCSSMRRLKTNW
jgi:hypothetical protein